MHLSCDKIVAPTLFHIFMTCKCIQGIKQNPVTLVGLSTLLVCIGYNQGDSYLGNRVGSNPHHQSGRRSVPFPGVTSHRAARNYGPAGENDLLLILTHRPNRIPAVRHFENETSRNCSFHASIVYLFTNLSNR